MYFPAYEQERVGREDWQQIHKIEIYIISAYITCCWSHILQSLLQQYCEGIKFATPKCVSLACRLSQAKNNQSPED